jgi:hypothetical protein
MAYIRYISAQKFEQPVDSTTSSQQAAPELNKILLHIGDDKKVKPYVKRRI